MFWALVARRRPQHESVDSSAVNIVSSTSPQLLPGPAELRDILSISCCTFGGHRLLLRSSNHTTYLLWMREVFDASAWTFEAGLSYAQQFLDGRRGAAATFLIPIDDLQVEKASAARFHVVSIQRLDTTSSQSIKLPYHEKLALEEQRLMDLKRAKSKAAFLKRNISFVLVVAILVLMAIALSTLSDLQDPLVDPGSIWMTWQIPKGSEGPQNQLQFTWPHPSFTFWAAETGHSVDEFSVRLDDLTMMPTKYIDDDEVRYRAWFETRYPEIVEVAHAQDYLNSSFWLDPRSHALPIDHEYHVTHCILALKRYWKARESSTHVCPRDLEHGHMAHCFDVLENLVIPDFRTVNRTEEVVDGMMQTWLVSACF